MDGESYREAFFAGIVFGLALASLIWWTREWWMMIGREAFLADLRVLQKQRQLFRHFKAHRFCDYRCPVLHRLDEEWIELIKQRDHVNEKRMDHESPIPEIGLQLSPGTKISRTVSGVCLFFFCEQEAEAFVNWFVAIDKAVNEHAEIISKCRRILR